MTIGRPHIIDPRTIALVTDWCRPRIGGIESHLAGLASALVARGHSVHLVTTTPNAVAPAGVALHVINSLMFGEVAAPNLIRVRELRALLADTHVDLVHAHGMFSTLAIGSLLAARHAGIPSVTTNHSLLRQRPTLPAAWLAFKLFSGRATMITAVSAAAAVDARRASGRVEIPVLPNGLDPRPWTVARRLSDKTTRVVSVMRLSKKKSPRDLVEVVPSVLARAGHNLVFTIVGDGPERDHLERRARHLGLSSHVEFLGACEPHRVAEILAESTIFALPSRREAFGLALLEARAAGLPIVARASGGVPEVVVDGRHGLLANTTQEFADAIARLALDVGLRQRFSAAARVGLEAYDWDAVIDRHLAVYRRAMQSVDGGAVRHAADRPDIRARADA